MRFKKLCKELYESIDGHQGDVEFHKEDSNKIEHFYKRTNEHIDRVKKNARYIVGKFDGKYSELLDQVETHDSSKLQEPELAPYIEITWMYKCKDDGVECDQNDEIVKAGEDATFHHIKNNKHHAEYWDDEYVEGIMDGSNRDGIPDFITDASEMDDISLLEMVSDWTAMSWERDGNNSARNWADMNIGKRWNFTEDQKALIYEAIGYFEELDAEDL